MLVASYEQRAFSLDEREGGEAGAASCMFCDDVLFRYIRYAHLRAKHRGGGGGGGFCLYFVDPCRSDLFVYILLLCSSTSPVAPAHGLVWHIKVDFV